MGSKLETFNMHGRIVTSALIFICAVNFNSGTASIPKGDAGGNAEIVIPATGETIALHAYWDRSFGGYYSPSGAVFGSRTGTVRCGARAFAVVVRGRFPDGNLFADAVVVGLSAVP